MKNFEELSAAVKTVFSNECDMDCIDLYNVGDMDEYTKQNPHKLAVSIDHTEKIIEFWNVPMYRAFEIYSALNEIGFSINSVYTTNNIIVLEISLKDGTEAEAYINIR